MPFQCIYITRCRRHCLLAHTFSISFSFTFVSIHAGLPYCHMFAAAHCDIGLYSSVIFNWHLHNRKKESSLKEVQNSIEWFKVLVHIEKPPFSHSDETVTCELLAEKIARLSTLSEQYRAWYKFPGQLEFYSESGISKFTFSVIYSVLLVNGSTNCHVRRIMKSINRRAATIPNNWRSLMIT